MAEDKSASSEAQAGPQSATDAAKATGEQASKEAQHTQSTNEAAGSTDKAKSQTDVYAGLDLSKLSEEARTNVQSWVEKREKEQMRYITHKSQEVADVKKKAQYYDDYLSSQEYTDFKAWHQSRGQAQPPSVPASPPIVNDLKELGYTDDEAIKLANIVDKVVENKVAQKEKVFSQQVNTLQYQQRLVQANQDLAALAKLHPDVYDMIDSGLFKPFVQQYVQSEGKPLEVAYEECKKSMTLIQKQRQQTLKQEIQEKKEGVSVTPTSDGDRDIVYVEPGDTKEQTHQKVNDAAFKAAYEGHKVRIRVRNKNS